MKIFKIVICKKPRWKKRTIMKEKNQLTGKRNREKRLVDATRFSEKRNEIKW